MAAPVVQSVSGLCNPCFTVKVSGAAELREYQCSPSGSTSCLGKRAHRLECRGEETSDESRFRLLNADGRLRIWRQAHEAMDTA
ncbi:hypothetical protein TNCV_2531771 [Trichonephila clavipes]|nr:hypothetical protein TNCV_2531771 [Trichonephila clavipes]